MTPYLSDPQPMETLLDSTKIQRNPKAIYDLYAVANHRGATTHSGHYFAYVLNHEEKQWYKMNDSVTEKIENERDLCGPLAYMLFYRRREKAMKKKEEGQQVEVEASA